MLAPANVLTLELLSQRLYHDFCGVVDFVHHQPELASVGLQYHNVDRFLFSLFVPARIRHFQFAPQIHQRQQAALAAGKREHHALISIPVRACSASSRTSSSRLT